MALLRTDKATAPIVPGEILNVLFVLMCQEGGTTALIREPKLCGDLLATFQSTSLRTLKARVLRLLTIICRDGVSGRAVLLDGLNGCKASDGNQFGVFTSVFKTLEEGDPSLFVAMTLLLDALALASTLSPDQSIAFSELEAAGGRSFLERIRSGSLKSNDPGTDAMLQSKAAAILQGLEDAKSSATAAKSEPEQPPFAKALEEAGEVSYHVDLTENSMTSPQAREEQSVDMRSVSKFKLHIPGVNAGFTGERSSKSPKKSPASSRKGSKNAVADVSSLPQVLSQLQEHSQQLDQESSAKLAGLLAQISASLADAKTSMAKGVVDLLEQSLSRHSWSPKKVSPQRRASGTRDAGASPQSAAPDTASKRVKFALFANSDSDEPREERTASEAHTESVDESQVPSAGSPMEDSSETHRRANIKLSLPMFQSFRKGPGLGATPACTPIATASVRKDAKRHVFPSHVSESLFVLEEVSPDPTTRAESASRSSLALPALSLPISIPEPEASGTQSAPAVAPPASVNDLSRFRKLLAMGAPRDAVRTKMQQAGVDPNLLDEEPQGFAPSPRAASSVSTAASVSQPVPATTDASTEVDVSKFRKLLAMGAPMAAVKAKMVQAGVDPSLLDQPQQAETIPQPPAQHTAEPPAADVSKFKKLLSMGAPLAAVKAKMVQAGLDPALLDGPVAAASTTEATLTTAAPVVASRTLVKDDPEYAKFFKLLAMNAPAAAVKAKMTQAGLNPALLDTPDAEMPGKDPGASTTPAPDAPPLAQKVKDHPDYAKFFKLLSMGAPAESVKAKIRMAGLNPDLLDTPDADMPSAAPTPVLARVKDDPEYAKFFKLLAMNAPVESVKARMRMAGLNADLLDTPDALIPNSQPSAAVAEPVKVKDDPEYAKFFKLLTMNAPSESVKARMRMAGLNADLLDTPDAILPSKNGSGAAPTGVGAGAPASTPAGRRAHLALSIPPPVKQTTRPFYWQHLRGDVIKGTVWEEIERDSSNQDNEVPLVLNDSDLAVLESEFPPPSKDGPVTGGRQRSGSLDLGPMSPGSPLASPRVVFLIDRSRANNISIIVKQFRVSNAALREAIMKVDTNVLSLERVQGLIKILPTEEEMAAISAFQGDPMTLNEAERILKELMTVPRLKQRLSSLQATLLFPGLVRDLEEKIGKVRNASKEIANSVEFKSVLQVILQVGNKMNNGTNRGNAKGFRLNDLTKLAQLKSVDRSVTLLHYVARMIRQKKGNIVHLGDSLASLYDVQNVPIPELQGDMNKVNEVIDTISAELTAQQLKNSIEEKEAGDAFVPAMTTFLDTATVATSALKEQLELTMQLLQKTMKRFDRDPDDDSAGSSEPEVSGMPSPAVIAGAGEFFNTIYEFSVALSKADRDNEMKRLREEKRLKQQQQKTQIPMRSHSSIDLLGRRRSLKAEGEAGPETPEKGREGVDPADGSTSPRPARSASMSAIIGVRAVDIGETAAAQSPLAAAKTSMSKMMSVSVKPAKQGDASTEKTKAGSAKKQAAMGDTGKPPQHLRAPSSGKRDESQPLQQVKDAKKEKVAKKSPKTILTAPGKIIRASKNASSMSPLKSMSSNVVSPLKIEPPAEKSRMKPLSVEKVVPFDGSSIGEIRSSLESKHGARASPREASSKSRRGRDAYDNNRTWSSPEEHTSEAEVSSSSSSLRIET